MSTGTGCFSLPHFGEGSKPAATAAKTPPPPAAEVSPEQVNDANARQMADQLQQEVDRDGPPQAPADVNKGK
jgi:hypothetical protein